MSMIGSDYSSQRRPVEDLEKDYEAQRKKAKEREAARDAKTEQNVKDIVRKKDDELDAAVRTVKDRYESTLENQNKSDRVERENYKEAIYNRAGRSAKAVSDDATFERDRVQKAADEAEMQHQRAMADAESSYDNRSKDAAEQANREKDALVEAYRKQITEAHTKDDDTAATNEYRSKVRTEADQAIREARQDAVSTRRMAYQMSDQYEDTLKDREEKADKLLNTRLRDKDLANANKLIKNENANRASRELETQPLREQVMETAEIKREAAHEKNIAREETIKDLESDWSSKFENQTASHDIETQKLKEEIADTERSYGSKLGSYMKEKDAKMAAVIARQNLDHREQMTNATKEYDRSLDHVKLQSKHDQELSNNLLARDRASAADKQANAMEHQAATYQRTMENQRAAGNAQIKNLERVVNNKSTTADAGEISAGAEQTVRSAVTRQYDKVFQAEADRNANGREHLVDSYEEKLNEARQAKNSGIADLSRKNMMEQAMMRDTFVQHVSDVEENKRQMLDLANASNERMSDSSLRNNARSSSDLRRHYDDIIASKDLENASRMQDLKTQSEFEKRTLRRDFQAQNADLIRDHRKELAEVKSKNDDQVRDLKAKLDTQARENDRQMKQVLANQERELQQRLAENASQTKDRERTIARNNEEELEKVKKANALLLSKKG